MPPAREFKHFLKAVARSSPDSLPLVIGGQAVNLWCDLTINEFDAVSLKRKSPFTSRDLDIVAVSPSQLKYIARILKLKDSHRGQDQSCDQGAIVDPASRETIIQAVHSPYGISPSRLNNESVTINISDHKARPLFVRVLKKGPLLESKVKLCIAPDSVRSPRRKKDDLRHVQLLLECISIELLSIVQDALKDPSKDREVIAVFKKTKRLLSMKAFRDFSARYPEVSLQSIFPHEVKSLDLSPAPKFKKYWEQYIDQN